VMVDETRTTRARERIGDSMEDRPARRRNDKVGQSINVAVKLGFRRDIQYSGAGHAQNRTGIQMYSSYRFSCQ
jgi:hypothetical protein